MLENCWDFVGNVCENELVVIQLPPDMPTAILNCMYKFLSVSTSDLKWRFLLTIKIL